MNSLLFEAKKDFINKLTELDKQYDGLCKKLENDIDKKCENFEKIMENLNDKNFEMNEVSYKSLIFLKRLFGTAKD